ncbi:phage terminase small subunit P27 family [Macrococcus bovicus]|uniref:phage terminase small subunit P27 family n=1 Tax=Macrococcus bovicus TaxID=69968 RepID=UPI0025A5D2F6|nr:phage terminase small subunit P27 family [Macrococcus bovicus]WJP97074.1 phage terminase small subunit P27 family [Macrococcus bovicus]
MLAVPTKKKLIEYLGENYLESDEQLIDLYLENHKIYREMQKEMKKQPMMMPFTNKAGATNMMKNPLLIEIPKYTAMLNNLLKSLGLTPAQRAKLQAMTGGDDDEDDDFNSF